MLPKTYLRPQRAVLRQQFCCRRSFVHKNAANSSLFAENFFLDKPIQDLIKECRDIFNAAGNIIHVDGSLLGKHNGIIDYTIGQRKGLKIGGRKGVPDNYSALYVIKINNINNDVIVGPKEYLGCKEIEIRECNWITDNQNLSLIHI